MYNKEFFRKAWFSKNSLKKQVADLSISLLDNFLHPKLLENLKTYIVTFDGWEHSITPNRVEVSWVPDSVIEECHIVMQSLTEHLEAMYQRDLKFIGISLWKDKKYFLMPKHTDNPIINISIQVYLTECSKDLGTIFEYNDTIIKVAYKENSGYIADNSKNIPHYTATPILDDHVRYSLYARWALNQ